MKQPIRNYPQREPEVSIGYLAVVPRQRTYGEAWLCLFPEEFKDIHLSRSQLTALAAALLASGEIQQRGTVTFKSSDVTCYTYQYKLSILRQLAEMGIVESCGLGLWQFNPRYVWAGPLGTRLKAVKNFEEKLKAYDLPTQEDEEDLP